MITTMRTENRTGIQMMKEHWLLLLAMLFFAVYSIPAFLPEPRDSGDIGVNIYFSRLFAETNRLAYEDTLNELTYWGAHQRNARSFGNVVIPHSFVGIIAVTGFFLRSISSIMFFMVPIFGVLLVLMCYVFLKDLYGAPFAEKAAALLFVSAPLWIDSSQFVSNIPSLAFFIAGLYYFNKTLIQDTRWNPVLCGIFWGASSFIRYTDILFIGVAMAITIICTPRTFFIKKILLNMLIIAGVALLFIVPILLFQLQIFGNPFTFAMFPTIGDNTESFLTKNLIKIQTYLLPNRIHFDALETSTNYYLITFFFPLFVFSIVGLYLAFTKHEITTHRPLYIFVTAYSAYLILYFSSGKYHGYSEYLLGASYIRYWLFLYIVEIVAALYVVLQIPSRALKVVLVGMFILANIYAAVFSVNNNSALIRLHQTLQERQNLVDAILERTEPNAVLFSHDPTVTAWPERSMVTAPQKPHYGSRPSNLASAMCNVIQNNRPVYMFQSKVYVPTRIDPFLQHHCKHMLVKIDTLGGGLYAVKPI